MKKFSKKLIGGTLAPMFVATTLLSGCSGAEKETDGQIDLSFWSIYPEGDPNYEWTLSVIERFEEIHPEINIEYTGISFWDYFTKITTSMTDQNGPDIYIQTIKDNQDRAKGGVSMELSQFFDDEVNEDIFFDADLDPMRYEDGIYGVPYALDDRVLYYNVDIVNTLADTTDEDWLGTVVAQKDDTTITGKPADLIDEDGDVRAPETWDELMAYQELLTVYTNDKISQIGFDTNIGNCKVENVVWTAGGDFFDDEGNCTVATDPQVKEGFETWYELNHILPINDVNSFLDTAGDNTTNLFWSGNVAMMINTNEIPWQNDKLDDESKINMKAAPVPYDNNEENHYNFTGGFSMEISNRLANESVEKQEAAWEFVEYLCSPEIQKEVLVESSNMPSNVNVYDELMAENTDQAKEVVFEEMSHRKAYDYIYNAPSWFSEVQSGVTDIVSDKYTIDEGIENIQKSIEKLQSSY